MTCFKTAKNVNRLSLLFGIVLWSILILGGQPLSLLTHFQVMIEKILLLAPLVLIPMGFSFVVPVETSGALARLYLFLVYAQPFGALSAVLSFLFLPGIEAGLLALPWFLVTMGMACFGALRLLQRGLIWAEEVCIDFGFLYTAIGGGWFVLSRFDIRPMGFDDIIVLLTVIHFHYTGFGAHLVLGLFGRRLPFSAIFGRKLYRFTVAGMVLSPPFVALGITFFPLLEWISATYLALNLWLFVFCAVFWILPSVPWFPGKFFSLISLASVGVSMFFAATYAYGEWTNNFAPWFIFPIPQMIYAHGFLNAFGFILFGFLTAFVHPCPPRPVSSFRPLFEMNHFSSSPFSEIFSRITVSEKENKSLEGVVPHFKQFCGKDVLLEDVDVEIQDFYEKTTHYAFRIYPCWRRGFAFLGKGWNFFARKQQQLVLPLPSKKIMRVENPVFAIPEGVLAPPSSCIWARVQKDSQQYQFFAFCAVETNDSGTFFNLYCPFPKKFGAISFHLKCFSRKTPTSEKLLYFSSRPELFADLLPGIYWSTFLGTFRLPIQEKLWFYPKTAKVPHSFFLQNIPYFVAGEELVASQEFRCLGIKFLEIFYEVLPKSKVEEKKEEK